MKKETIHYISSVIIVCLVWQVLTGAQSSRKLHYLAPRGLFVEKKQVKSSEVFLKKIKKLESEMFPEFVDREKVEMSNSPYLYFGPSWHFKSELILESDLKAFLLDKTKRLLSVGSGLAYIERFLVKLGISKKQIVLSDVDETILPNGFVTKKFDMFEEWPRFQDGFDLIIFPESVLINSQFDTFIDQQRALYHIIIEALANLKVGGEIRINGHNQVPWNTEAVEKMLKESKRWSNQVVFDVFDDLNLIVVKKLPVSVNKDSYAMRLEKSLDVSKIIDKLEIAFDNYCSIYEKQPGVRELHILRRIKAFLMAQEKEIKGICKNTILRNHDCLTQATIACLLANRKGFNVTIGRPLKYSRYFHALIIKSDGDFFKIVGKNRKYRAVSMPLHTVLNRYKKIIPIVTIVNLIKHKTSDIITSIYTLQYRGMMYSLVQSQA